MRKKYDSPEMEVEKFKILNCVITESPDGEGWGGSGDDYDDDF